MFYLYCWVFPEQHGGLQLKETQTVNITHKTRPGRQLLLIQKTTCSVGVLKIQKMTVNRNIYATFPSAAEVDDQG